MEHPLGFSDITILFRHTQHLRMNEILESDMNSLKSGKGDYEMKDDDMIDERGNKTNVMVLRK